MSNVVVKEVKSRKDLKKFINFPKKLYKDNEYYVPTLNSDIKTMFNRKKNAAYEYCDSLLVLAYKDNQVVGRVAAIVNDQYNKKINAKQLRFTDFDVIDDFEVTKAMFDYIGNWGKSKGMNEINGPLGFTDIDRQGMLIEGFDLLSMSITNYNYPYYVTHMEKLGLEKDVDHVEYQVQVPKTIDPRIERVKDAILRKFKYKLLKFNSVKEVKPYIYKAFDIYNEAFAKLHGTVWLNERQIDSTVKQFIGYIDLDYVPFIVDENDDVVGFAVLAPSISKALQKNKGKLFPFGWYSLLRAFKKSDVLEMYLIAVKPELQGYGLNSILMNEVTNVAIKNNIKYAETGPELEDNYSVRSQWDNYDAKIVRKRRCFIGKI